MLFRRTVLSAAGPVITITPRYKRTHLLGGTFSNAFGDFVVRGELGFSFNRFLITNDPTDADGVVNTNESASVLGLDWSGLQETFISMQFFVSLVTEKPAGVFRDRVERVMTLLVRRTFLNARFVSEVLWLQGLNRGDGLVRPKLRYELRSNITAWIGFDIFYGDRDGLFGQFDQKDRVVFGVEWGF